MWGSPERWGNAVPLAALAFGAGAVDALSYYALDRVFTANMTGNIVLLSVSAGRGGRDEALHSLLALVAFIIAAILAFRVLRAARGWHRRVLATLVAELGLLIALAVGWLVGLPKLPLTALAAVAMGLQSAAVNRVGDAGISTTYVTGTLTSLLGQLGWAANPDATAVRRIVVIVALAVGAFVSSLLGRFSVTLAALLPIAAVLVALADTRRRRPAG